MLLHPSLSRHLFHPWGLNQSVITMDNHNPLKCQIRVFFFFSDPTEAHGQIFFFFLARSKHMGQK